MHVSNAIILDAGSIQRLIRKVIISVRSFQSLLAMDFRHGVLYCAKCQDYVYDSDFERIRLLEHEKVNAFSCRLRMGILGIY